MWYTDIKLLWYCECHNVAFNAIDTGIYSNGGSQEVPQLGCPRAVWDRYSYKSSAGSETNLQHTIWYRHIKHLLSFVVHHYLPVLLYRSPITSLSFNRVATNNPRYYQWNVTTNKSYITQTTTRKLVCLYHSANWNLLGLALSTRDRQ